jgi:MFS family permease
VSAGSLYRTVITAVPFLLPLQFQLAFGWTPLAAGLLVAALFAGNIAIKPATTPLMRRWGIRRVLLVNGALSVLCFGVLARLSAGVPMPLIASVLFVSGALRSIGFTAYNTLAFSDVDSGELTHASTLNAAVQELAAGLGIAVGALLLGMFTPVSHVGGQAYSWTYLALGLVMMLTIIETLRLPKDAGAAVTR